MNYNLRGYSPLLNILITFVSILLVIFVRELVKWTIAQFLIIKEVGAKTQWPNLLEAIDPIGLIMFLLVGIGWQKPLVLPLRRLRNPKQGQIVIGMSGFIANLGMVGLGLVLSNTTTVYSVQLLLARIISFSMALTLVNLFPLIPFDSTLIFAGINYKKMFVLSNKRDQIQVLFLLLLIFPVFSTFNQVILSLLFG